MSAAILRILPKKRGRSAEDSNGSGVLRLFPRSARGRMFIYAIAFKGDVVKVGKTGTPQERLRTHWRAADGEVKWVHLFEPMSDQAARMVENRAPAALKGFAKQINGSEWFFATADRASVVAALRPVIVEAKTYAAEAATREVARQARLKEAKELLRPHGLADMVAWR